jgi:hypothetical protein
VPPSYPSTPMLTGAYVQKEWRFFYVLTGAILQYKQDEYQEWECLVETPTYGYVATTPVGYVQDVYENRFRHGSASRIGRHTDRFVKKSNTWVNA